MKNPPLLNELIKLHLESFTSMLIKYMTESMPYQMNNMKHDDEYQHKMDTLDLLNKAS